MGAAIPLGVYDAAAARWESGPNAAVLQVTAGGGVDYTGDGNADSDFPLLPGEASALAAHYAPGTQLVRSLTTHFSAMDTNPCWRCIGSCTEAGEAATSSRETCPDCQKGSIIRLQNRTLSEYFPVSGTSLNLGWPLTRVAGTSARCPLAPVCCCGSSLGATRGSSQSRTSMVTSRRWTEPSMERRAHSWPRTVSVRS